MNIDWDGKGLPPVGTTCEAQYIGTWLRVKCIAHYEDYAVCVREYTSRSGDAITDIDGYPENQLRTVQEGASIACALKSRSVDEIVRDLDVPRAIAARAYDLGYRKFEIVEEDV